MAEENEKKKVLYIEDNPLDQMALSRLIAQESIDYELYLAESLQEASQLLNECPDFDIIIADYLLKDGDAFGIFDLEYPAPIIFLTGSGDEEVAIKAIKQGALDYLIKDDDRNYLKILPITIENVLKQYKRTSYVRLLEMGMLNTNDAIIITDSLLNEEPTKAKVKFVNQAFTDLFGFSKKEIITQGLSLIFGSLFDEEINRKIFSSLSNLKPIRLILELNTKRERKLWGDLGLVPILNEKKNKINNFLIVCRDITSQKTYENNLIKARQIAEEAQNAEKHFLAVMSHEIRTPINAIVGLVELLYDTQVSEEQRDYIASIKSSTNSLLSLVNDTLDLSKIEQGELSISKVEFSIEEVLKNCIRTLKYTAEEKGLEMNMINDVDLPPLIKGDPVRLTQVIMNLLNNAIKFTKEGEISVKTKILERTANKYRICFQIKDTGIGIPEDRVKTIFEKYKQASQETMVKYGGTGLGLYIVKKIVSLQDGAIELKTEIDTGSTFSVYLDYDVAENLSKKTSAFKSHTSLREYNILIAEDNLMNKMILRKIFKKWELNPVFVSDGEEACNELKKENNFDLLLMDIHMPNMDGIEAVKFIRDNIQSKIKIVMMTASVSNEGLMEIQNQVQGFLPKPSDADTIYTTLSNCLAEPSVSS